MFNRRSFLKMSPAFPVGAVSVGLIFREEGKEPFEADISVLKAQGGDIVVLSCDGPISQEKADRLKAYFEHALPKLKAIVLSDGMKIDGVIRGA